MRHALSLALPLLGALLLPLPAAAQTFNPYPIVTNAQPDLTASLQASSGTVGGGEQVVYTLTVRNVGLEAFVQRGTGNAVYWNAPASGISALLSLPPGATYNSVTATGGFQCANVAAAVTCTGGSLATGASATIAVTALAPRSAGTYVSSATVDATNTIAERIETNNSASTTVVVPPPDLSVSVLASKSSVDDQGLVSYYVHIDNAPHSGEASGVALRYTLPAGAALWNWQDGEPGFLWGTTNGAGFSCSASGLVVTCGGGTIGSGARGAVTLAVTMPRTNGVVTGSVVVDPNNAIAERDESNNAASISTTVVGRPDLSIEVSHAIIPTFQRIIVVHNLGAGPANNVRVDIEATKWEYYDDGGPDLLLGVFADSGFSCSTTPYLADTYLNYHSGDVITCTGATIPASATATIRVMHLLTTVDDSRNTDATVDPRNAIPEVNEGNNHGTASTRI